MVKTSSTPSEDSTGGDVVWSGGSSRQGEDSGTVRWSRRWQTVVKRGFKISGQPLREWSGNSEDDAGVAKGGVYGADVAAHHWSRLMTRI